MRSAKPNVHLRSGYQKLLSRTRGLSSPDFLMIHWLPTGTLTACFWPGDNAGCREWESLTSAPGAKDAWQCSPLPKLVIGSASMCLEHHRPSKQPWFSREAALLQSKSRHFGKARLANGCLERHQHWKIRITSFLAGAQRAQPNQTKTDCTLNAAELDAWESQTASRNAGRDAGDTLTSTCNGLPWANTEDANANDKR